MTEVRNGKHRLTEPPAHHRLPCVGGEQWALSVRMWDRKGDAFASRLCEDFNAIAAPLTQLWDRTASCLGSGLRWQSLAATGWHWVMAGFYTCKDFSLWQWVNNIKCAAHVSRAGDVHGLGQAFRMALYALGILHKLPGFAEREKRGNWSVPSLETWHQNAGWLQQPESICRKFQVTLNTSLRNSPQFQVKGQQSGIGTIP